MKIEKLTPREARALIRKGEWQKSTASLALGYAQANLVILPSRYAFDFLLFCQRNSKPCPLLEVLESGRYITEFLAAGADITTDLPLYNIYRKGKLTETIQNVENLWQEDFVTFLLGCSHSFEEALLKVKIPIRHIEEDRTVPMYITNIPCKPAGIFGGTMVVFNEACTRKPCCESSPGYFPLCCRSWWARSYRQSGKDRDQRHKQA